MSEFGVSHLLLGLWPEYVEKVDEISNQKMDVHKKLCIVLVDLYLV